MEYSRSNWDFLLWPRAWHQRMNTSIPMLIPGIVVVGFYDMLSSSYSILNDFILNASSGITVKVLLFLLITVLIGFLDVFCFAWPIADLCRYLAKRSQKFITPGFNVIFMKSYAYSHLFFLPVLLLMNPTGLQQENLLPETPFLIQLIIRLLIVLANFQIFWQIGIMMRTISVKSKIELPGKLISGAAIYIWSGLEGSALWYLIQLSYRFFSSLSQAF